MRSFVLFALLTTACGSELISPAPGSDPRPGGRCGAYGCGPDLSALNDPHGPRLAISAPEVGLGSGFGGCEDEDSSWVFRLTEAQWALGSTAVVTYQGDEGGGPYSIHSSDEDIVRITELTGGFRGSVQVELVGVGSAALVFTSANERERMRTLTFHVQAAAAIDWSVVLRPDEEVSTDTLRMLAEGVGVPIATRLRASDGGPLCGFPPLAWVDAPDGVDVGRGEPAYANSVTLIDAQLAFEDGLLSMRTAGAALEIPLRAVSLDALDGVEVHELEWGAPAWPPTACPSGQFSIQPLASVAGDTIHGVPFEATGQPELHCPSIVSEDWGAGPERLFGVMWGCTYGPFDVTFSPVGREGLGGDYLTHRFTPSEATDCR